MKRNRLLLPVLFFLLVLFLSAPAMAKAEKAKDIVSKCKLSATFNEKHKHKVKQENYKTYWDSGSDGMLTVTLPRGEQSQGIMVSFFGDVPRLIVDAPDIQGEFQPIAAYSSPYENAYISFPSPQSEFRIRLAESSTPMRISRLRVLTLGELPKWVQQWEIMDGNAELLVVSTHPDDELLWFGGLLPTYAGELKKKVMVVYMVGGRNSVRKNELLDGLWTCGVRYYPEIGYLEDTGGSSEQKAYDRWGGQQVAPTRIVRMIRKYHPQVVVTQDIKGEYGHIHHIITVRAVIDAVETEAGDAAYDPDSADEFGAYIPQKLYLHLWKENQIVFDWRQPLTAFDGATGVSIANQAFKMHVSQQTGKYRIALSGAYDCRLFGLYWSRVGDDVRHDDLFENVVDESMGMMAGASQGT